MIDYHEIMKAFFFFIAHSKGGRVSGDHTDKRWSCDSSRLATNRVYQIRVYSALHILSHIGGTTTTLQTGIASSFLSAWLCLKTISSLSTCPFQPAYPDLSPPYRPHDSRFYWKKTRVSHMIITGLPSCLTNCLLLIESEISQSLTSLGASLRAESDRLPALVASEEARASLLSHLVRISTASLSPLPPSFPSNPSPYLFALLYPPGFILFCIQWFEHLPSIKRFSSLTLTIFFFFKFVNSRSLVDT